MRQQRNGQLTKGRTADVVMLEFTNYFGDTLEFTVLF